MSDTPRFSVVIPTFERRDVVVESVRALANQDFSGRFEVIVVVDGSRDGSAAALGSLDTTFPLEVLEQSNQGLAATRNRGAAAAGGEILLFLDDDMEADPSLLREHDRSHREGADVVLGHLPLHPDSPQNFLSTAVGLWADERGRRLAEEPEALGLREVIGGQMSISRELFDQLGGFDAGFTRDGAFGNEDLDFGRRLAAGGRRIVFNPRAISRQRYVVTPRHYLRQWRDAGRTAVLLARKHPDQVDAVFKGREPSAVDSLVLRWLRAPMRVLVLALVAAAPRADTSARLFFRLRTLEYQGGIREAGGIPGRRPIRVLCYHSVADLSGAAVMEPYGVVPRDFSAQMNILRRYFRPISVDEFLRFVEGHGGVPRRAVLLTFDDCFQDLVDTALPVLSRGMIPATAFAVTGRIGRTNDWDLALGAAQISLAGEDDLVALPKHGVSIGSHTRTHRMLNRLRGAELDDELAGSLHDLEALGVDHCRLLAYPHGEYDERVAQAAAAAGYRAAFTVRLGMFRPGGDRFAVPRIEILRRDRGLRFWWKLFAAGRPRPFSRRSRPQPSDVQTNSELE